MAWFVWKRVLGRGRQRDLSREREGEKGGDRFVQGARERKGETDLSRERGRE